MVKHTQAIRQQFPAKCLSMFNHFLELAIQGLNCINTFQKTHFEDVSTDSFREYRRFWIVL